jgi:hypothetical protein
VRAAVAVFAAAVIWADAPEAPEVGDTDSHDAVELTDHDG